ncbi:methyltransferase domain-containing protein [Agriterribacter sp.]|uniref:class I SAM-dependent methyltransferase n=1 Tax=Agriterribacter sp. TaxID=2821509 RepID=UPI002BABB687|nr:methyltransferase domain-containing protein [Agriterribacter sp.]HRP55410.1 methyltransferase domain-containing protein [Agriterribacter sp.]
MKVKFSSKFPKLTVITNRDRFLQEYVEGKTVLHGGCVDSELFGERIATKLLLHDILATTAKRLVGVDVDEEGINEMKRKGYRDVYYADLESWDYDENFDVIILGEIIEHIDNCGLFLQSVLRFCRADTTVIFTTPNSYYFLFWIYSLFGKESIHPDHNYIFSYNSIKSLLGKFSFDVIDNIVVWEKVDFTRVGDTAFTQVKKKIAAFLLNSVHLIKFIFPQYGKGIIVITRPAQ